ncbi:NUDIX hydrolase [Planctomicrobium sp. SH668]|uniref:NUDIX hydrolase n=1 Tax=Planctomicrobium sp. SH668 TaxID=3448126 RepID=UPI003F5AE63D
MLDWIKIAARAVYDRRMRDRVMGFRPVVMCLIEATDADKFLLVCPSSKPQAWMFLQEGIEPGESVEVAALRGLNAELGLAEEKVHYRRSTWIGRKVIPEQKGERDIQHSILGMRGKSYYGALIKLPISTPVILNHAELFNHEWLTIDQIRDRLQTNSHRKQELIRLIFDRLLKINKI